MLNTQAKESIISEISLQESLVKKLEKKKPGQNYCCYTLSYFQKGKQEDTGDHRPVNCIVVLSKLSD